MFKMPLEITTDNSEFLGIKKTARNRAAFFYLLQNTIVV